MAIQAKDVEFNKLPVGGWVDDRNVQDVIETLLSAVVTLQQKVERLEKAS